MSTCKFCLDRAYSNGLCERHFARWKRAGKPADWNGGKPDRAIDPIVAAMLEVGKSNADIAAYVGKSLSSLSHYLKVRGIVRGRKGNIPMSGRNKKADNTETRVLPWLTGYSVARDGVIYSENANVPYALTPKVTEKNAIRVKVSLQGRVRDIYVAVAVLEAWHGPRPEGHVAGYRDGNSQNCHADNLYWTTPANHVPAAEFVRAWQTSLSAREAAEKLGITQQYASVRALSLRKHGVPLKEMTRGVDDWDALAKLAQELANGDAG